MDDRRLADLVRRQGGLATTAQLVACGLSRAGIAHRVATGRLFSVRRGVYGLSPHVDASTALWAAVLAVDPARAAVSHWSAAGVHGMTAQRWPVHVTVPGTGGRSGTGLRIHATRGMVHGDVVLMNGLRVTSPARTVLDIAARASDSAVARLIREGEFLGLLQVGAMAEVVATHAGHHGLARVRRVDPMTSETALRQTPLEDQLDALIRTLPVAAPERQVVISGISGAAYRVDFGWPGVRLAAEADGRSAHQRASSLESDRYRDNDLGAVGWQVLRFTRHQLLRGRADAGQQIVATLLDRGGPTVLDFRDAA